MSKVRCFWKFNPDSAFGHAQATAKAADLVHHVPACTGDERYFNHMGWAFDIGRKPFLVECDGQIYRVWACSTDDARKGLSLPRKARIVCDPFSK